MLYKIQVTCYHYRFKIYVCIFSNRNQLSTFGACGLRQYLERNLRFLASFFALYSGSFLERLLRSFQLPTEISRSLLTGDRPLFKVITIAAKASH